MFITKPIAKFEYKDNTLTINESAFKFNKSVDDLELIESLISKGAYASALLYLNKNSLLESVDNNKITMQEYRSYLQECTNLMKENVYELKASNLRPLCSINGLEILENDNHIFRGKSKLFVEDFREEISEEAEGTQVSDIAPKRDQELGKKVIKPKKVKHLVDSYDFNVGFNHKFKGFTLTEQGRYERGNFVLIKEGDVVKAIHKSKLSEAVDEYGNALFSYEEAESKLQKLISELNAKFKDYDYNFDYRFERGMMVIFDKNEWLTYDDYDQFEQVDKIVRKYFGQSSYLEPENSVIFVIAGCRVSD